MFYQGQVFPTEKSQKSQMFLAFFDFQKMPNALKKPVFQNLASKKLNLATLTSVKPKQSEELSLIGEVCHE